MPFGKSSNEFFEKEDLLREKLEQLISEIESLKILAEDKIQVIEKAAKGRLSELEAKLAVLEGQVGLLNTVIASMDPNKRIN